MYIAIAGNIGSGKSSLTGLLSERYQLHPVYEAVDENPYLQDFYQDMPRWSFHSQVFFLGKRLKQHLEEINHAPHVVQDRTVFEDAAIFARNLYLAGLMPERDWVTYQGLYQGIVAALRRPDLLVYIRASVPTLRERISRRGRIYEKAIPDEYLEALNRLYQEWISSYTLSPLFVIEGDQRDFVEDPEARRGILADLEALGLQVPMY